MHPVPIKGSVEELFDLAIDVETTGRDFYQTMAVAFGYLPNVGEVWRRMMWDEWYHIQVLREVQESLVQSVLSSPEDETMLRLAEEARAVLSAERRQSLCTLGEACTLALEFESTEANRILMYLVSKYGGWGVPLGDLAEKVEAHRQKLIEFHSSLASGGDMDIPAMVRNLDL